jgi:hypothetical protein
VHFLLGYDEDKVFWDMAEYRLMTISYVSEELAASIFSV